ncbi:MAG: elongation factor 1-beta [Candidatus Nanohaloarchaea archaeon]
MFYEMKMNVVFKVMPEDAETDLENIKKQVKERLDIDDVQEENVAFGLKAVKASTIVTEEEGGTDYVENQLEDMEGVQSVEIETVNKI